MAQASVRTGQTTTGFRATVASCIGTVIEAYDYLLYGLSAALVFPQLFFPSLDPHLGTMATFGTFAVGFIGRPMGGIIAGHYGDKMGRKNVLIFTMVIAGLASVLMGLLPTYGAIGIWAPILLIVLRLLQGTAFGGEWAGAVLMTSEHAPQGRRGFYASWPQVGSPAGLVLAIVALTLVSRLPTDQFLSWGWRVPFLFSIVLVAVGMYTRLKVLESPEFKHAKEAGTVARTPIIEAIRVHPRNILLTAGLQFGFQVCIYILVVFMLSYATVQIGFSRGATLSGVLIGSLVMIAAIIGFSILSDRVGRRPVIVGGSVAVALFSFPLFWLIDTGNVAMLWFAIAAAMAGTAAIFGPMAALVAESFKIHVRFSGASLGYQLGAVLGGGFTPIVATALVAWAGDSWVVSAYMFLAMVITGLSALMLESESSLARRAGVGTE